MTNPIAEENRIAANSVVEDRRCGERRKYNSFVANAEGVRWIYTPRKTFKCQRKPNSDPRAIISKPEMDCLMEYDIDDLRQCEKLGHVDRQLSAIMHEFRNILLHSAKDRTERFEAAVREILNGKD